MKRSRWMLSICVVIHRFIFKNNLITSFPCFIFKYKTGIGLLKMAIIFYWVNVDLLKTSMGLLEEDFYVQKLG